MKAGSLTETQLNALEAVADDKGPSPWVPQESTGLADAHFDALREMGLIYQTRRRGRYLARLSPKGRRHLKQFEETE